MSVSIIKTTAGCTIQDEGRYGFQALGINPGGAMDTTAMYVSNILLGNDLQEPVIEFIFPSPVFYFRDDYFIALSGADFNATIDDVIIPINRPIFVPAKSTLRFTKKVKGNFGYLSVQGGLELNEWLGSYSTNKKAGAGGLYGTDLKESDSISFKQKQKNNFAQVSVIMPWQADVQDFYEADVYCIAAPETHLLPNAKNWWQHVAFTIQSNSDRMGYRLHGGNFSGCATTEIISSAVTKGTIQLPPNKEPIVLMADHQTTGGYPRIANVCKASIGRLAQQPFNEPFYFNCISIESAEQKWIQYNRHLQILQQACTLRIKESFHVY